MTDRRDGLARVVARACEEAGRFVADREAFAEDVAARLAPEDDPSWEDVCAGDLAIAIAATHRDPAAIAEFDRRYGAKVEQLLGRDGPVDTLEFKQRVWERVFVGSVRRGPRIAQYVGRGPLLNWVLVLAARLKLDLKRGAGTPHAPLDLQIAIAADDPELAHLKARYREEFATAVREAAAMLSDRQRTMLALCLVDGLDTNGIAAIYRVHRTSAGRWLAEAKDELSQRTRKQLSARLQTDPEEIESVLRLIASRMHVTLGPILRPPEP